MTQLLWINTSADLQLRAYLIAQVNNAIQEPRSAENMAWLHSIWYRPCWVAPDAHHSRQQSLYTPPPWLHFVLNDTDIRTAISMIRDWDSQRSRISRSGLWKQWLKAHLVSAAFPLQEKDDSVCEVKLCVTPDFLLG